MLDYINQGSLSYGSIHHPLDDDPFFHYFKDPIQGYAIPFLIVFPYTNC